MIEGWISAQAAAWNCRGLSLLNPLIIVGLQNSRIYSNVFPCRSCTCTVERHHKGSHHLRQLLVRYGTYEHTKLGAGGVAEKADVSCVPGNNERFVQSSKRDL